jgi:hypothetical protein
MPIPVIGPKAARPDHQPVRASVASLTIKRLRSSSNLSLEQIHMSALGQL